MKLWDVLSGVCIKTYTQLLGEVTSLEMSDSGHYLLSGTKGNSNRLWDLRTGRAAQRYKGHQNTARNFIRTGFGSNGSLVVGGSEDGMVYIWDLESGLPPASCVLCAIVRSEDSCEKLLGSRAASPLALTRQVRCSRSCRVMRESCTTQCGVKINPCW